MNIKSGAEIFVLKEVQIKELSTGIVKRSEKPFKYFLSKDTMIDCIESDYDWCNFFIYETFNLKGSSENAKEKKEVFKGTW